ncbi:MAG: hypothetical protein ABJC89_19045, partial [Acidobacteriota bacterium]
APTVLKDLDITTRQYSWVRGRGMAGAGGWASAEREQRALKRCRSIGVAAGCRLYLSIGA